MQQHGPLSHRVEVGRILDNVILLRINLLDVQYGMLSTDSVAGP